MLGVQIDGNRLIVREASLILILQALGLLISKFCFDPTISTAGNCRSCLVEIQNLEKPVASCVTIVEANNIIWTNSIFSIKARENIFELLLINHPLDCPICDQAGECDLQDQSKIFGGLKSRFFYKKRSVADKNTNFFVKTIMTRCIHCTRCVRFNFLVGNETFGILNRGGSSEIGNYVLQKNESELIGNVIDLCPVGALTSRTYSFQTRPWELKLVEGLDLNDGLGSNLYLNYKNFELIRITPKINKYINGNILTNSSRFSFDSLTVNRLKKIYEFDLLKYKSLTWFSFINKISIYSNNQGPIFLDQKINILINEELDIFNILFLKKLSNKYCKKIQINLFSKINSNINLYISNLVESLNDIEEHSKSCLLLSSNLKIECAILNLRIKLKHQRKIFSIFCLGRYFSTNIKTHFYSLNLTNILLCFEAKLIKISLFLIQRLSTVMFVGESFYKRFFNFNFIYFFFLKKFPTVKLLRINTFCNEAGIYFLNIKNFYHPKNENKYFCINLEENVFLNKYLFLRNLKKEVWWFNTHRPFFQFQIKYLIPIVTTLEVEGCYINLENRAQKTQKFILNKFDSRSLIQILTAFFYNKKSNLHLSSKYLEIIFEMLQNNKIFTKFKKKIIFFLKNCFVLKSIISLYPLKTYISALVKTNSWTKNSKNLNTVHLQYKRDYIAFN